MSSSTLRAAVAARKGATLTALAMLVAAVVLMLQGAPSWWLGVSLLVGAAVLVWRVYREPLVALHAALARPRQVLGFELRPSTLGLDVLYVVLIAWVATYMMRDVFFGIRPVSHDHTVHFVKAWQLHHDFLSHGKLYGWSHRWFAGYPVDYLYPIGTDLFVNAVHALGLGAWKMSQAYGYAFVLAHFLTGYSGYRLGRVLGGPHVGALTGLLMVTDMSAFRFGGWQYGVVYGVWPQSLSLAFALLATAHVPAIYEGRKLRNVALFGLWMGAAIITHPIELIYLAILLLASLLAAIFSPAVKSATGTLRLLAAYALSALIACASLLPFLSTRDQTTPMGVWWDSTYELGKGLIALTAFPGTLGFVLVLAIPGAVVLLRTRRYVPMFVAFMALIVPTVSNGTFIDELHLPELSKALTKIQWLRMSTMAKPFWFAMASAFVVAFVEKSRELATRSEPSEGGARAALQRDVVLACIVSYLTLPIVVPACQSFFTANVNKVVQTELDRRDDPARARLEAWLAKNLPRGDGFYRVCVNTGHNHDLMDLATQLPVPLYKRGFTPAENFIYKVNVEDPKIIEAVNVRFMITKKPMPQEDYEQVTSFGAYRVFRFKRWNPRPFVVYQKGVEVPAAARAVKLERFENERIVLRAGAGAHGLLRLNVSYFPRWRAYHDGKRVALWPTALSESRTNTGFMTVRLAPGSYEFKFEPSASDRAAVPLTLLGLFLVLALVLADRRLFGLGGLARLHDALAALADRLSEPAARPLRRAVSVVAILGALVMLIVLARMQPKLALEQLGGDVVKEVRYDFLEQLSSARVRVDYPEVQRRCKRFGDRFICRDDHDELDNEKYVASTPAEIEEYRMVRCIRARPEENARLVIDFPKVPAGDAIVGYFGVERAGRLMRLTRPVDFRILVDGKPAYEGATTSDNKMHWFEAKVGGPKRDVSVGFIVSARNVNKRYFCFYAQMANLAKGAAPASSGAQPGAPVVHEDDEDDGL